MTHTASIAAVILTLNEEQDLGRALQSLHWCDELIVLDSGSIDSTQQIAAKHGAKFIQHVPQQPFLITDQRNWALDHAGIHSDWILFLDADEEVSHSLSIAIRKNISKTQGPIAYDLAPRFLFLGKWLRFTQCYPTWHPRLLRRGYCRFEGGVWESFSPKAQTGRIHIPYEHYAYSKGLEGWLQRHYRYASWDAHQIIRYQSQSIDRASLEPRNPRLRLLQIHFWWTRPVARFVYKYIVRLGFLDGWKGLLFCMMMAMYDLMVIIKVIELKRHKAGLPL